MCAQQCPVWQAGAPQGRVVWPATLGMERQAGDRGRLPVEAPSVGLPPGLQLLRQEAQAQLIAHPLISLSALRTRQEPPTRAVPEGWVWRGSQPPGSPRPGDAGTVGSGGFRGPLPSSLLSLLTTQGRHEVRPRPGAQTLGPGTSAETGSGCLNGSRYRWVVAHGDGATLGAG